MGYFTKKFTFEDCEIYERSKKDLFLYPVDKREKITGIAERIMMDNKNYLSTHCCMIDDKIYLKMINRYKWDKKEREWLVEWESLETIRLWFSFGFGVKLGKKQIKELFKKCEANGYFPEETKDVVYAKLVMEKLVNN